MGQKSFSWLDYIFSYLNLVLKLCFSIFIEILKEILWYFLLKKYTFPHIRNKQNDLSCKIYKKGAILHSSEIIILKIKNFILFKVVFISI